MTTQLIDLEPQVLDLILYAGDGVKIRLTVVDKDDVAINLTGAVKAQIRPTRESIDPASATFTVDLSDSVNGIVMLSLTSEQTQLLIGTKKYKGVWDVQWTPAGEQAWTILQGKVECVPDVSR